MTRIEYSSRPASPIRSSRYCSAEAQTARSNAISTAHLTSLSWAPKGLSWILPTSKVKSTRTFCTSMGSCVSLFLNIRQKRFPPTFSLPYALVIVMTRFFVRSEATVNSVEAAVACPTESNSGIASAHTSIISGVTRLVPASAFLQFPNSAFQPSGHS